jgi:hypothetical protein
MFALFKKECMKIRKLVYFSDIAPFHDPANASVHAIELYLEMGWFVDKTPG